MAATEWVHENGEKNQERREVSRHESGLIGGPLLFVVLISTSTTLLAAAWAPKLPSQLLGFWGACVVVSRNRTSNAKYESTTVLVGF